jgi:RNA polymerase sigma-70 factor (ECF subfamily)
VDHQRDQSLAEQFDALRPYLQAVAYRMLGSVSDAEDAVQECWLRLTGKDPTTIEDLRGWLTVVTGRICLDLLRRRRSRREDPASTWLPEPVISEDGPEETAVLADSVGLALLVVLETLTPTERLAFVLHDVFGVSFDEIAEIAGRSPVAVRQLASRARRRVRQDTPPPADPTTQRRLVTAFLAASRNGDFDALVSILHQDVVFRADVGAGVPAFTPLSGVDTVAAHVLATAPRFAPFTRPVVVNGTAGALAGTLDSPIAVIGFTIADDRIIAIDIIADPDKLRALRLGA